jgi:phosphate-selective porin
VAGEPLAASPDAAQGTASKPTDPRAAKPPKTEPAAKEGWHRDGFALKKGKDKIALQGYFQEDFRHFDWTVKGDETGIGQAPARELRRLRTGVDGNFGRLTFEFVVDPRKSQAGAAHYKNVTLGYRFGKGLNLLAGHFKPQLSQEFLTSAGKTDFVDRSMLGSRLVPDRDWGAGVSGEIGRLDYAVGAFAGDGDAAPQSAGNSGALRLSFRIVKGLTLSGSFMEGRVTPDPRVGATEPSPKGASGVTASGFNFWNRAHVKGTRRRLGGDLEYSRGPFQLQAEYLENREQRLGQGSTGLDIPDVAGRGFRVQASYVLTGEKKGSTVDPRRPLFKGGPGAIEIVARVEGLKFDDVGDSSGFAGYGNRARNIAPSGATTVEAGVNYFASNFLKLQGDALWESYNDPLIAPQPGKTGRYFTILARIQLTIP